MLEFQYMEGSNGVFRPVVPLILEGPAGQLIVDVLVDTGADSIELPIRLARRLGVELPDEPAGDLVDSSGNKRPYFPGRVVLQLRASHSIVNWPAQVSFTEKPIRNLFGQLDALEFFHAHFLGLNVSYRSIRSGACRRCEGG